MTAFARRLAYLENTVIVGDPWLIELAQLGHNHAKMARLLLRTQVAVCVSTGHIMDLSNPAQRSKIARMAATMEYAKVHLRCMRCGCLAYLPDWVVLATMEKHTRLSRIRAAYLRQSEALIRFMEPCTGTQAAQDADTVIGELIGEE